MGVPSGLLPHAQADRTGWQFTKHGALQSFEHEALLLPTPPTDDIIRSGPSTSIGGSSLERERGSGKYFTSRGIGLDIKTSPPSPEAFRACSYRRPMSQDGLATSPTTTPPDA